MIGRQRGGCRDSRPTGDDWEARGPQAAESIIFLVAGEKRRPGRRAAERSQQETKTMNNSLSFKRFFLKLQFQHVRIQGSMATEFSR